MGTVSAAAVVPGPVEEARALWFDTRRWPAFVEGFRTVVRADPEWPDSGSIVWDSTPHGPGRTVERISAPGVATVESQRLRGTQTVTFEPGADEVRVRVRLEYALKDRNPLTPLIDLLFVRRALRDSVTRTMRRYAAERRGDAAGYSERR